MGMEAIGSIGAIQSQQASQTQAGQTRQAVTEDAQIQAADTNIYGEKGNDVQVVAAAETQRQAMEDRQADQQEKTQEAIDAENKRIQQAVSELNKKLASNTEAVFGIHDKTNRVTIKMIDKSSKKVIKEFPADKTLDMIAKVWELAGIMVDEKR